ncbi:AAA family ATPase [Arcobacter sp. CECT 8985]|uniref:AAA family ATPase n=1 Tax=Arcobacter sp. CECT 8985 TaxID=1935424 RepID=UPI00100BE650|nr:AAA family ATPase [Arcobacter sp. CECT 8985]RXJ87538.1 hypothetical protein CRU93_03100 [Arcobacter sp. CECT 8985]
MNESSIIILIVGASGVGKDTLIRQFKNKEDINVVRRYITRKSNEHENNHFITKDNFKKLQMQSFFISSWFAHDNFYGIPKNSLKAKTNIISVSRSVIKDFENKFNNVFTINITLEKNELKQRLLKRSRESLEQIEKRLKRADYEVEAKNLIEFENNESIEVSKSKFYDLIISISKEV